MTRRIVALSLALASSPFALGASDHTYDTRWYIAPTIGYDNVLNGAGDAQDFLDAGFTTSLAIGKPITRFLNLEIRGIYSNFPTSDTFSPRFNNPNSTADVLGGGIDALFFFNRADFSPYAITGVGAANNSISGLSGTSIIADGGVGFLYRINDYFSLRSDVRYRFNSVALVDGIGLHEVIANVGFVLPFGAAPQKTQHPLAVTAGPIDSDSDGVFDNDDRCPGTPVGVKVDKYGCELDSDTDGVVDSKDHCPNTAKGIQVDPAGCPIPQVFNLRGVNFEYNSATITPDSQEILDGVVATLHDQPELAIEVAGHTSSEGSAAYNLRLSQLRADSVVQYLKTRGVVNTLSALGYGELQPIADNDTEDSRAQNRRVELIIEK